MSRCQAIVQAHQKNRKIIQTNKTIKPCVILRLCEKKKIKSYIETGSMVPVSLIASPNHRHDFSTPSEVDPKKSNSYSLTK